MTPSPSLIAQEEEANAPLTDKWIGGGNTMVEFYYLAGPMSNLPGFNFEAFHEAAEVLREQGYNLVNPAELDYEIARAVKANANGSHRELTATLAEKGLYTPTWAECLRRDIEIVSNEKCVGVIVIDGWEESQGAQFETYVAYKLLKPVYKLTYEGSLYAAIKQERRPNTITGRRSTATVKPTLTEIDRRDALNAAGVRD